MARYEKATKKNYELGISILELAKKAHQLYLQQDNHERRKLLNTLLSNCAFTRGSLSPTYHKPFDILAQKDKFKNWRPIVDEFRNWAIQVA
jgi:site-specific DNA recombinase